MFQFINLHLDHEEVRRTRKREKTCWCDAVNREVLFNIHFSMEIWERGETGTRGICSHRD